jgi:protein-S-isoprenylcysteine O-methyltransferase Ste14
MNPQSMLAQCLPASGRFFFKVRNGLFPAILVLLLLVARPAQFLGSPALDRLAMALGFAAALAGQALRLAVIGYAYVKRGGKNREVYANRLVTRGFYAHTRNPMYAGNLLIIAGFGLLYGSVWIYGLVVPFFAWVYLAIVSAEEAYLREKFGGEFEDYVRRVNRFVPDFRGLSSSLAEFAYDWRRALVKEYNTIFFTLAALAGLSAWKIVYLYGFENHRLAVSMLCASLIPLTAFYGGVRYLKKTRKLQPARMAETETVNRAADPGRSSA